MIAPDRSLRFTHRVLGLRPSCVREIMRAAEGREMLSFAGGLPRADLFPAEALAASMQRVLSSSAATALQYGPTEGYRPLREYVAQSILAARGIDAEPDDILITNGSQQALDLVARVFLDPGDVVLMETPSYLSAIQAFELSQPRFVGIALRDEGIDVDELAAAAERYRPKLVYLAPTFQNPTGVCYGADVRRAVARLVDREGLLLVEDDPYGELAYDVPPPRPIHAGTASRGLLMGSFSKIVAPGLRLGWVWADPEVIRRMVVVKQATDLCTSGLLQRVLHDLLSQQTLPEHLRHVRASYRQQRDAMVRSLAAWMPAGTAFNRPPGGMFVWASLPGGASSDALLKRTLPRGLAFAPGTSFYPEQPRRDTLRLNFTLNDEAAIERGVRLLAEETGALLADPVPG